MHRDKKTNTDFDSTIRYDADSEISLVCRNPDLYVRSPINNILQYIVCNIRRYSIR
jgi:hypothetical protein